MSDNMVIIHDIKPMQAMAHKDELLASGLKLHEDFEWAYIPGFYDNFSYDAAVRSRVEFEFEDPATATFFRLKWGV